MSGRLLARRLIVSADDFGLDPAVNEAVERAHRDGVLTQASLMVAAPAAADAVAVAKRLPDLRVGLHLALVDAVAALAPGEIPDLVDGQGRFSQAQALAGVSYFFRPIVRRQLAAEIRAQFRAFSATGLTLSHVDAHKHMHIHPTIGRMVVEIGREFGLTAVRLPREPMADLERVQPGIGGRVGEVLLAPWIGLLARQIRRAGLRCADRVFGIRWSGAMDEERVAALIAQLPPGVSEIYAHPAVETTPHLARVMPGYRHAEEFAALISPRVAALVREGGIDLASYGALGDSR